MQIQFGLYSTGNDPQNTSELNMNDNCWRPDANSASSHYFSIWFGIVMVPQHYSIFKTIALIRNSRIPNNLLTFQRRQAIIMIIEIRLHAYRHGYR